MVSSGSLGGDGKGYLGVEVGFLEGEEGGLGRANLVNFLGEGAVGDTNLGEGEGGDTGL